MNTIVNATNELADKSDRWLFIGVLLVLGFFTWLVLQHLLNQSKALVAQLQKEQETHEAALTGIINKQNETNVKLALSLDHNATASANNATAFNECAAQLKLCREQTKHRRNDE